MSATPIESRIDWAVHRQAADAARARGADFDCAQSVGFVAVEKLHNGGNAQPAKICQRCKSRGVRA